MTRMARGRDTHLAREEIAAEALRQFDEGSGDPSIRQLATALGVAPSAIYHHFSSRGEIIGAALDLVWQEITIEVATAFDDPFTADPVEVLVTSGLATRRAFVRHYRIAQYMAAIPQADAIRANTIALTANLFERMGISGEDAATPFHAYATYALGTSLFAATRQIANQQLAVGGPDGKPGERFRSVPHPALASQSNETTRAALDEIMDLSAFDPQRDVELFEFNLRRIIATFDAELLAGGAQA